MKNLPPARSDIEALEHDLYKRGDITSVARLKGIDPSTLNKQLNPDEPDHKGQFYPFMLHLWYVDHSTDELGDRYMELAASCRNGWRGVREPERTEVLELTRAVNGSMFDLLSAQINSLPYTERMKFVDKALSLLDQFKNSLHFENLDADQDESAHPS